ncbi:glycoside hydrolase family 97 protein [Pedobacter petrophilus]|uniref:Glycoside hydrolase family 97 protein n=1 Tax=Pedobacter petrophilus TaxID=1908241 RepID=A0A7K0G2H6_9SPHI|nr:glycoside hydrolase family 97 protein [Pedobacter petrophilus]MRX77802.1 glycoside hydrolase family 97 protein [Pedobacter petrophilus]
MYNQQVKFKKPILTIAFIIAFFVSAFAQKSFELKSPNGAIKVTFNIEDELRYSVFFGNDKLFDNNRLGMVLRNDVLGNNPKLISAKSSTSESTIKPYISLKYATVTSKYNKLLMTFKGNYSVEFRVFDNGVAYRFITTKKGDLEVLNEEVALNFPTNYDLHVQQPEGFKTAYEENYSTVSSGNRNTKMSTLPVLIDTKKQYKILVSESDLTDYPCLFLKGSGNNGMSAAFPKAPLAFDEDGDRSLKIVKEADYIAKTNGNRSFPWRYFVITTDDRQLLENTMTLQLASTSAIKDPSWIKPGQASWEWWNDAAPYGPDVNFESGYNLETYKYYIDFAAKFGLKYIIMDEGWAATTTDPYTPNPKVDVHELIRYGKEKNVGVVVWLTWLTVHKNMDLFKTFKEWGIKGVKIDFMDRSDQWMVNYYERVAKEAAKNELLVDFHGAFKPAGLEYKYPNLISYEGVRGMEQMGGTQPKNSLFLPFMRNAVGPMDYTPGAMISMQPEAYRAERPNAASIGTRAYQMALFVVFESGIQMLADNPTLYYRNLDCTEFITSVPTTWDETKAIAAEVGELAVVAKRKGNKWFIGGITNGTQKTRTVPVNLDFLSKGKTYTMTYFEDGINAGRQAMDYRKKTIQVKAEDKISIKMVRNGGYAASITAN